MKRLLALLLLAGCATTNWRGAAVGATALDTEVSIQMINQGSLERNPALSSSPGRMVAVQVALLGAIYLLSMDLEPEHQATVWKWVTVLHLGAVTYNLSQR